MDAMLETARQPGHAPHSDVPRPPFGGKRRLINAVAVRFEGGFTTHDFDAGELIIRNGDSLVVQTDKGPMIGRASGLPRRDVKPLHEIKRVLRVADAADLARWEALAAERLQIHRACIGVLRRTRLPMKIVAIEIPLDRSRVLVFFSSEQRVDFRGFVRALAKDVDGRIDMRQLGIRDGAGAVGGIGPCGNELCCSTFLTDFSSISIRFAKDQGLSLNPQRIMGMCGRLKCCLVYEQPVYKDLKRFTPRRRTGVITPRGAGNVLEVDILARKVRVGLSHAVEMFHLRDVVVLDRTLTHEEIMDAGLSKEESVLEARRQRRGGGSDSRGGMTRQAASVLQEDYLWDDMAGDTTIDATVVTDDGPKKSRRRKKSGSGRPGGARGERAPSPAEGGGEASKNSSRRRRSKRPGGAAGGPNDQAAHGTAKPASDTPAAAGGEGAPKRRRRRRSRGGGGGGGEGGGEGGGGGASSGGGGGEA